MLQGRFTTPVKDPQTGQPFPIVDGYYTISQDRFDSVIKNVIPYFPVPNSTIPGLNYVRVATLSQDSTQFHGKVDWNLPHNDRLSAHYGYVHSPLYQPSLVVHEGWNRPIGDQNLSITYTHIFSPQMVNEFRVGYNRDLTFSNPESAKGPDVAKQIGLMNTTNNPYDFGLPSFGPLGYSGVGIGYNQNQQTIDQIFQFNDSLSYHRGKHDLKFGTDIRRNRFFIVNDFPSNPSFSFYGTYTGNSVADMLLGTFDFTNEGVGDTSINLRRLQAAFYASDSYKATRKLTLTLGLRYEYPGNYGEINNRMGYLDFSTLTYKSGLHNLFVHDMNNFAPRFGFAYSPFEKWVVRGGFGVDYDMWNGNESQFWGPLLPPISQIQSIFNTTPTPTWRVQQTFPAVAFQADTSPNTSYPDSRTPYVYAYNMNVEHEWKGVLYELGYVGSTGHKLNRRFMANLAIPAGWDPGVPMQDRRLFPSFGDILSSRNDGWSNYNGLNFKAEKPFSKGFLLLAAYTYGKALDIGGPDEYVHWTWFGLKDLRGPSYTDTRQRLVLSYVYDLPVGRGKRYLGNAPGALDKIVGGWQATGITTFNSGHPITPVMTSDWAGIGNRRMQPALCIGPVNSSSLRNKIRSEPVLGPYWNVQNTIAPEQGFMGNCGRDGLIGPGVNNWDMGFLKNNAVTERVNVQFRAEFFNIWNHAQFGYLDNGIGDSTFGRITSARAPRDIQFSLKVIF